MKNNLESEKMPEKEVEISYMERREVQRRLIKKYCKNGNTSDAEIENICAENWAKEYADNFDQVDKKLVKSCKFAQNEEEEEEILDKIQEALEELNRVSG